MAPSDWLDDEQPESDNSAVPGRESDGEQDQYASFAAGSGDDELSIDDLEACYLRALESSEGAEWDLEADPDEAPGEVADGESSESPHVPAIPVAGVETAGNDFLGSPAVKSSVQQPAPATTEEWPEVATPQAADGRVQEAGTSAPSPVKPARIIEACLFVGGHPLSAKKLASLLDGNNDASVIELLIDELNQEYAAQGRPYEIRLGDGGYRLSLRSEFEAVRSRVYGVGPRDIKLSQDVLEVLALVAYQQPITQAAIDACKPNSTNLLRQLLRRELISLARIDQSRNGVEYRTTPRFLQLFGLGQLSELPRPEDLSIR